MRFPFGKYKGRALEKIPDDYLLWCLDHCDRMSPTLRQEIETRLGVNKTSAVSTSIGTVIGGWYRTLAKEFHPDRRRGSHEGMVAINRARELLAEVAGVQL